MLALIVLSSKLDDVLFEKPKELPMPEERTPTSTRLGGAENRLSPVQEHHIDFLLEEEFASSAQFLSWFLEHVQWNSPTHKSFQPSAHATAHPEWQCSAVRSVTTDEGETDVLVIYRSAGAANNVAILIEDKIRASFQPAQAARYIKRGEEGKKTGKWDEYWTCLVSPERYSPGNKEFDGVVSLESIRDFFHGLDPRTRFKAGVITRAIELFSRTGVQVLDQAMTAFRAYYATKAEIEFKETSVKWPIPREAWWDDQWFRFIGSTIPHGSEILYKARLGFVDLAFSKTDATELYLALAKFIGEEHTPPILVKQTGKSASLRILIEPIHDFTIPASSTSIIDKSFQQVNALIQFHQTHRTAIESVTLKRLADRPSLASEDRKEDVILEVGFEGGILAVKRQLAEGVWAYRSISDESTMADLLPEDDLPMTETMPVESSYYTSLESALQALDRYNWTTFTPLLVHPDYRTEVLSAVSHRSGRMALDRWREALEGK